MPIEFVCPNGHRLSCSEQFGGRSIKCPKCGTSVSVPAADRAAAISQSTQRDAPSGAAATAPSTDANQSGAPALEDDFPFLPPQDEPDDAEEAAEEFPDFGFEDVTAAPSAATVGTKETETSAANQPVAEPELNAAGNTVPAPGPVASAAPPAADAAPLAADRIVFLCPNEHKLNAPAALAGRAGKCPHCGAKFVIPDPNEVEEEEAEPAFEDFTAAAAEAPARAGGTPPPLPESQPATPTAAADETEMPFDFAEIASPHSMTAATSTSAMGQAFARLWQDRSSSSVVEIRLQCGDLVVPDWYSPQQSDDTCGTFATQDKDGRFTVTVLNWRSVERISVRGIDELPEGAFE